MRRSLLAVGLTAALLAPSAGQPTGLGSFWAFLASLWSAVSLDEGCGADPNGLCRQVRPVQADGGCGADPNGRCKQSQRLDTDAGCGADPWGLCSQTHLETDEGCGADPFGRCSPAR